MKDFFISYNKADGAWAEWIAWNLESAGYSTLLQAWDFKPGSNFVLEMDQATQDSECIIAVLSPNYIGALFTQPEWAAAFAQDPKSKSRKLLPIRVRECELKGLLAQIVCIDLVGTTQESANKILIDGVSQERAKPQTEPPFPNPEAVGSQPRRFPGALPPIWNVPHIRNRNFSGREPFLQELDINLNSQEGKSVAEVITGLGGIGKTQLILEYIYRHITKYDVVWWLRAEEPATLSADLVSLAWELDLPEKDADDQILAIKGVRNWLQSNSGWLLVFDNASGPSDILENLPQGGGGHILISSRNPNWRGAISSLNLTVFEPEEAVEFLIKRSGKEGEDAARALVALLGFLPLALEQAGAYIEETARSITSYLSLFQSHQNELLLKGTRSLSNANTVASTWEISFQRVEAETSAGAGLLNLCAFLASDEISLDLLKDGLKLLPKHLSIFFKNEMDIDEAVAALRRYSLVERTEGGICLHRLVQVIARNRLNDRDRKIWTEVALRIVSGTLPNDKGTKHNRLLTTHMLSHAFAVAYYAETYNLAPEKTALLTTNTAFHPHIHEKSIKAKQKLQRELIVREVCSGPAHPDVADVLLKLGHAWAKSGSYPEAKDCFERALIIYIGAFGSNHPLVEEAILNLAAILKKLPDKADSLKTLNQIAEDVLGVFGATHSLMGPVKRSLGIVLWDLGQLENARMNLYEALLIIEAVDDRDSIEIAEASHDLGLVLLEMGMFDEARLFLQQGQEIFRDFYGLHHPTTAKSAINLSYVLKRKGDIDEMKRYYNQAILADEEGVAPLKPELLCFIKNPAAALNELYLPAEARIQLERSLEITELACGNDHPMVADILYVLGLILRKTNLFSYARARLERAAHTIRHIYGNDSPILASVISNLGLVVLELGDLNDAQGHFLEALKIDSGALGADSIVVGADYFNLGLVKRLMNDLNQAQVLLKKALTIYRSSKALDQPKLADILLNLGYLYRDLGDAQTEREYLLKALECGKQAYNPEATALNVIEAALGLALKKTGDLIGAQKHLNAACRNLEKGLMRKKALYRSGDPEILAYARILGNVLKEIGRDEEARLIYKHILSFYDAAKDPQAEAVIIDLALVSTDHHDLTTTKTLFAKAKILAEAKYGLNHLHVAKICDSLAIVLAQLGEHENAKPLFEQTLRILDSTYPPHDPRIIAVMTSLGFIAAIIGDLETTQSSLRSASERLRMPRSLKHPSTLQPLGEVGSWERIFQNLQDLKSFISGSENKTSCLDKRQIAFLFRSVGLAFMNEGGKFKAQCAFMEAITMHKAEGGPMDLQAGIDVNNLAFALREIGDLEGSLAQISRALAIVEKARGADHPDTIDVMTNLSLILIKADDLLAARKALARAVSSAESFYKPEALELDEIYALLLEHLSALQGIKKLENEEELFRNYVKRSASFRHDTLSYVRDRIDYYKKRNLLMARICAEKMQRLYTETEGARQFYGELQTNDKSYTSASYLNGLFIIATMRGELLQEHGNLSGALVQYEVALLTAEEAFGLDSGRVAESNERIAYVLRMLGRAQEAQIRVEKALRANSEHDSMLDTLHNQGVVLAELGELQEAKVYLQKALDMAQQKSNKNESQAASIMTELGLVLYKLGEIPEALAQLTQSLIVKRAGYNHIEADEQWKHLLTVLKSINDSSQGKDLYETALSTIRPAFGDGHEYVEYLNRMINVYLAS